MLSVCVYITHRAFLAVTEQLAFQDLQDHLVDLASLVRLDQLDCLGPRLVLHFTDTSF